MLRKNHVRSVSVKESEEKMENESPLDQDPERLARLLTVVVRGQLRENVNLFSVDGIAAMIKGFVSFGVEQGEARALVELFLRYRLTELLDAAYAQAVGAVKPADAPQGDEAGGKPPSPEDDDIPF